MEEAAAVIDLDSAACRVNPAYFAAAHDPGFELAPHLLYMGDVIRETVVSPEGGFVFITMPPRHGKSTLGSLWTPTWFLDSWPWKNVLLLTHTSRFAEKWGRGVRKLAKTHASDLFFRLDSTSKKAAEWQTTEGGGMVSVGMGGPVTGRGGHLILVDDPVKDAAQANSELWRERTWEWWRQTVFTRREKGATVIVIMTRWHEDDFGGRILESEEAKEWRVIHLPAFADPGDVLGRAAGEPLWPSMFSQKELERIHRHVGAYAFQALYQGRPSPPRGSMFWRDRMGVYKDRGDAWVLSSGKVLVKRSCWLGQIADTAMKENEGNDWTVVLTFACGPRGELLVLDVARDRLEVPDQWGFVRAEREKWRKHVGYRWMGVEDKGSGTGLLQLARRVGLPLRELEAIKDKVTRATTASTLCANQMLFVPETAAWLGVFLHELLVFPRGTHDDQVDVLAYAAIEAQAAREAYPEGERNKPEEEERLPAEDRLAGGGFDDRLGGGGLP